MSALSNLLVYMCNNYIQIYMQNKYKSNFGTGNECYKIQQIAFLNFKWRCEGIQTNMHIFRENSMYVWAFF